MTSNACQCGRPSPQAFLCGTCVGELAEDLTFLRLTTSDLGTAVARMDRVSRTPSRRPEIDEEPAKPAAVTSPWLRGSGGTVALVATPAAIGFQAAELLDDAKGILLGWTRHLAEARGLTLTEVLAGAA